MELVIKLSEEEYINIKDAINSLIENGVERALMSKVCLAIYDGTPLPKGHGNLVDVNEVIKIANKTKDLHGAIWNAPIIIESDTEPIKENSIEQLIDDIEGLTWYRNVHGHLVEGATSETGLYKASDIAKILEKYKRGVEE